MSSWTRFLFLTGLAISSFSFARPAGLPVKPTTAPITLPVSGNLPASLPIISNISPTVSPTPATNIAHSITPVSSLEKSIPSTPTVTATSIHSVPATTSPSATSDPTPPSSSENSVDASRHTSPAVVIADPSPSSTPALTSITTNTHAESKTQSQVTKSSTQSIIASTATPRHSVITKIANIPPASSLNEISESPSQPENGNNRSLMAAGISVGVIVVLASVGIFIFRKWKLSPSRRFRNKLEEGKPYLQLPSRTGSTREVDQDSVFLKELHS